MAEIKKKKRKKKDNETNWIVSYSVKRDMFSVALYATEERSPEDEKLYSGQNPGGKKIKEKKNNEANWMVCNSAKLNHRTK